MDPYRECNHGPRRRRPPAAVLEADGSIAWDLVDEADTPDLSYPITD